MVENASLEHEKEFRETYELKSELKGQPFWESAFEYAATTKLTIDELNSIGLAIKRKDE